MTAFRILPDPFAVYFDLNGKLASGGNLHFYEAGTTTDADVFGDEALSVNNGATIDIGTDGRAVDDIWGDGSKSYRCRIYASDGTLIADRDNLGLPGSGSLTIPTLVTGDFLTNNGTNLLWAAVRQALDPAGAANKVMGSDGTNLVWVDKPADGTPGAAGTNAAVTVTSTSLKVGSGTGDQFFIQMGAGSAPASGTHNTQTSVTFDTAFKATPKVFVMPKTALTGGIFPTSINYVASTTGFTVYFGSNDDNDAAIYVSACDFDWLALGTVSS